VKLEATEALRRFLAHYENGDVLDALTVLDTPLTLMVALAQVGMKCPHMRVKIDETRRAILVTGLYCGIDDEEIDVLLGQGMRAVDGFRARATFDDRWYIPMPSPKLPRAM
jgi:hypothetical protein